ncbi:MAG: trigger factor [Lachnospiraceae bacterium]|jgi:trigger factor|nr:trigger factor [Lachnospiraceae bacterium]
MSLQVEKLEGNIAKLTIEASAEDFEKAVDKAYQKNKNKLSVPGFRKGKVPRKMIEKMYGNTVFYEEAANILIPSAYAKAIDECTEEVVSQPKIEVVQIEAGKPFIFTAEVALKPEVTLGAYKSVEIEKVDTTVTEEEIDEAVNRERESNARTISVEDRAVQDGDMVVLDFEGFMDGAAFEGGKGENYSLTIGSGTFIPGFEEQLIGAEIDKEITVNVTFPEDYHAEELKGKNAEFKCTIKEIKEKELPELDDEFASDVSEFDTMEEYREDLKKQLTKQKEETAEEEKGDKVVEAIIASSQMDIPEAMIETQQRQMAEDFARRIQMQGLSFEQYLQFTGLTRADFMEQMKPQTLKRIQSRLVLCAIAKAENIEATEEEYQEEIQKMADSYHMSVEELTDMMGKFEEKAVREDICMKKAYDLVVEQCVEVEK